MRARPQAVLPLLLLAPFLLGWSFFDPFHKHVEEGNRKAKAGKADAAVQDYDQAARLVPGSPIPDFNKGVALAEKGDAAAARDALLAAAASKDPQVAADALYNLGNVFLDQKQYKEAVDSYLKSLDLDPRDSDARRNLEIALQEQQQQQQQQQNQDQDQDQQDQQDQQQQQQQDPQKKDQQQQDPQPQQQDQQQQDQQQTSPQDSTQASPEQRLSRDDAERLLNAIQGDELKVLDQLRDKEPKAGPATNDW